VRVCKCFPLEEVTSDGHCDEERDMGILDIRKLFRSPFWSERNPGRVRMNNSGEHVSTNIPNIGLHSTIIGFNSSVYPYQQLSIGNWIIKLFKSFSVKAIQSSMFVLD